MSLWEGILAARVELASIPRPVDRFRRAVEIGRIILDELAGAAGMIPYGLRSLRTYYSLPPLQQLLEARTRVPGGGYQIERTAKGNVAIVKGVRYGPKERNLLDLYLPMDHVQGIEAPESLMDLLKDPYPIETKESLSGSTRGTSGAEASTSSTISTAVTPAPVALFVHGGVWATGERWHYAPMATRLAESGIIAAVMSYSLYPRAKVPEMVQEVSSALSWVFSHTERLQADPANVSLVGHSAGAHLCAMALLERAKAVRSAGASAALRSNRLSHDAAKLAMPKCAVLISGVYDIERHFEYEDARGVATLSTMCPAIGGHECFAGQSPAVLLAATAKAAGLLRGDKGKGTRQKPPLHGDVMTHWAGLHPSPSEEHTGKLRDSDLRLTKEDLAHLPPHVLMHSLSDVTVPCYETTDMHAKLRLFHVPSKLLLYNKVGHGDFVTAWRSAPTAAAHSSSSGFVNSKPGAGPRDPTSFEKMQASIRNSGRIGSEWRDLPTYAQDILTVLSSKTLELD